MILEYDQNGSFQGRLDGKSAILKDGYWEMENTQITPRFDTATFEKYTSYQTNIKPEDISDSLSSPSNISVWRLVTFINFLEGLGYSAVDFKMHFYDLIFLPFFMASLVLFASSIIIKLNQNDKFTKTIVFSLIAIFFIYFLSNLLDALGSTSQLNTVISKALPPLVITILSILLYQYDNIKRKYLND